MALTATASISLCQSIIKVLGMQLLFVISYSPHKYFSVAPFTSIENDFNHITLGLKEKRSDYERTIVKDGSP